MNAPQKPSFLILIAAFSLHAVIWFFLFIFKFNKVRRWTVKWLRRPGGKRGSATPYAAAVKRTSRLIPGASCLSKALTCHGLLLSKGFRSNLVIGVEKTAKGTIDAHAWVELDGNVMIGDNGNLYKYDVMKGSRERQ